MSRSHQFAARFFAVVSAMWLVGAFALVALFSPKLTLGELISMTDHPLLVAVQNFCRTNLPSWVWSYLAVPALYRPCWLMPVAFGLVAGGIAATLSSRPGPARSRRRS